MTNWEYCAIRVAVDGKFKKLKFFSPTGDHTIKDIEDVHLEIAKLGNESWELVTLTEIVVANELGSRVYYFKRSV